MERRLGFLLALLAQETDHEMEKADDETPVEQQVTRKEHMSKESKEALDSSERILSQAKDLYAKMQSYGRDHLKSHSEPTRGQKCFRDGQADIIAAQSVQQLNSDKSKIAIPELPQPEQAVQEQAVQSQKEIALARQQACIHGMLVSYHIAMVMTGSEGTSQEFGPLHLPSGDPNIWHPYYRGRFLGQYLQITRL